MASMDSCQFNMAAWAPSQNNMADLGIKPIKNGGSGIHPIQYGGPGIEPKKLGTMPIEGWSTWHRAKFGVGSWHGAKSDILDWHVSNVIDPYSQYPIWLIARFNRMAISQYGHWPTWQWASIDYSQYIGNNPYWHMSILAYSHIGLCPLPIPYMGLPIYVIWTAH